MRIVLNNCIKFKISENNKFGNFLKIQKNNIEFEFEKRIPYQDSSLKKLNNLSKTIKNQKR